MNNAIKGDTVVLDVETLSLDANAVVLTLSGVRFNQTDHELGLVIEDGQLDIASHENLLHLRLDVTEQLLAGRSVDPDTVAWWNRQSPPAQQAVLSGPVNRCFSAMQALSQFIEGAQVFARGTDFDPLILLSLFKQYQLPAPWKHNQVRDVRTYIDALRGTRLGYLKEWEAPIWFIPHHSLHDCIRDAQQMQMARMGVKIFQLVPEK